MLSIIYSQLFAERLLAILPDPDLTKFPIHQAIAPL